MHRLQIFHHDPDLDLKPGMLTLEFDVDDSDRSLLDTLIRLKSIDPSLSLRRSCREGVACPSYWWNPDKYVGPAGLLQAYRFPRRQSGPGHPLATRQSPGPLIGYSVAGRY